MSYCRLAIKSGLTEAIRLHSDTKVGICVNGSSRYPCVVAKGRVIRPEDDEVMARFPVCR
jgi:hypothetical protein